MRPDQGPTDQAGDDDVAAARFARSRRAERAAEPVRDSSAFQSDDRPDDLRLEHPLGCLLEPEPHLHIIRRRIPRVDVARDAARVYQVDRGRTIVLATPAELPTATIRRLEAAPRIDRRPTWPDGSAYDDDDAPAGAGDDVEAFRG
jgi:hypothetical protein